MTTRTAKPTTFGLDMDTAGSVLLRLLVLGMVTDLLWKFADYSPFELANTWPWLVGCLVFEGWRIRRPRRALLLHPQLVQQVATPARSPFPTAQCGGSEETGFGLVDGFGAVQGL